MTALDELLPEPRLLEIDHVDVGIASDLAWQIVRHADLGRSALVRALFAIRTLPDTLAGRAAPAHAMHIEDITSRERPGFRILAEERGREIVVGAIGRVWEPNIPYVEIDSGAAFAHFREPGYVKIAWALRVVPRGEGCARIELELRVAPTDGPSWDRFKPYFRLIGPVSHFIRRHTLAMFARELATPELEADTRALAGDELLPDALAHVTHAIELEATPAAIWPWLLQMGCRRAGWYSWDLLDNEGEPSAKEIHPELVQLEVGDILPATPDSDEGFEVLRIAPPRALVLGGLFDADAHAQIPFASARPARYWHVTWAFVLEPIDERNTRLYVRARAAFSEVNGLRATSTRFVHHFMERRQLHRLKDRVEGRIRRDGAREIAEGVVGAAAMAIDFMTPFLRGVRSHWGLSKELASRQYPGDALVPDARWSWTHGIEIEAPAAAAWPWIAQIGADRGGFYSYQWLENLAGCDVRNAESVHSEWEVREGDSLRLHPKMPALPVVEVRAPSHWIAFAPADEVARREGRPWASVSWLFFLEPIGETRSRLVSRFRSACSDDLASRLAYGPYVTESIGFVMDRRMLLGVKERVEKRAREALAR
jgi:hypothetical protein